MVGTAQRHLSVGVSKSVSQGMPLTPSLELLEAGFWRFRWAVNSGTRAISIWARQPANVDLRPALIVKANPDVGLLADVVSVAPSGSGWVHLPDATFVATAAGAVWVELHNRLISDVSPTWFDYVTAS